ncbi:MAG: hypothetical protein K9L64_07145 [Candidatus Izimaplasma sp.]|nr:hypothetical protein [Candidatus Izimaplasma bacterium]
MKMAKNLIEFRKRRIQNGKNARFYISILFLVITIGIPIFDRDTFPIIIPIMIFFYLVFIVLINVRIYFEESKLKLLMREHEAEARKINSKSNSYN